MTCKQLIWLLLLTALGSAREPRGWTFYSSVSAGYDWSFSADQMHHGHRSVAVHSRPGLRAGAFALFWQRLSAETYRGRRLRLSGWLRTSGVSGWSGMWLRVDPRSGPALDFETMEKRPIRGSQEWRPYSVEVDVPEEAEEIHFGPMLVGSGEVWFDDLQLTEVGASQAGERQRRRARHELPDEPSDLDFESWEDSGKAPGASETDSDVDRP